jgi:hypothetical protein
VYLDALLSAAAAVLCHLRVHQVVTVAVVCVAAATLQQAMHVGGDLQGPRDAFAYSSELHLHFVCVCVCGSKNQGFGLCLQHLGGGGVMLCIVEWFLVNPALGHAVAVYWMHWMQLQGMLLLCVGCIACNACKMLEPHLSARMLLYFTGYVDGMHCGTATNTFLRVTC